MQRFLLFKCVIDIYEDNYILLRDGDFENSATISLMVTNEREQEDDPICLMMSTPLASLWSSSFFFNYVVGRKRDKKRTMKP